MYLGGCLVAMAKVSSPPMCNWVRHKARQILYPTGSGYPRCPRRKLALGKPNLRKDLNSIRRRLYRYSTGGLIGESARHTSPWVFRSCRTGHISAAIVPTSITGMTGTPGHISAAIVSVTCKVQARLVIENQFPALCLA